MRVLIACEESQEVCKAFRDCGHQAYSCDIQECSGGHPEWHIQCNVETILKSNYHVDGWFTGIVIRTMDGANHFIPKWDLIIAHPPCTYLSNAGARWLWKDFFMKIWNADCLRICIENPVPSKIYDLPACTQVVQPYEYGEPWSKKTCLWLKGLPELKPTDIVIDYKPFVSSESRSKTFPGIAKAMAEQWG